MDEDLLMAPAPYRKRRMKSQSRIDSGLSSIGQLFSLIDPAKRTDIEAAWWFGCHDFEEARSIRSLFPGLKSVVAVDPLLTDQCLRSARNIMHGCEVIGIRKAVTSKEHHEACGGRTRFTLTSNDGASSSMLPVGKAHRDHFPSVTESGQIDVETTHLGELPEPVADVLVTDIQGSEYDVFRGNRAVIDSIRFIYAEVCFEHLYEGQGLYQDIIRLLSDKFTLVGMIPDHVSFGNALWMKREER